MAEKQKYALWGASILLWIFLLNFGLSFYAFGYLSMKVLPHEIKILAPLFAAGAILFVTWGREECFFKVINFLVALAVLMAIISISLMFFAALIAIF